MYTTIPLTPLVLDVDTGEDDALAILLAVVLPRPLRAVLTSYGNTSLPNATANTAALLELAGATHVPVIRGADAPLSPHPHPQAAEGAGDFVGPNGLCGVVLPPATRVSVLQPDIVHLADTLVQVLQNQPVSYVVTGPCTNLAHIVTQLGARARAYIDHVYIMGGALDGPGNSGPVTADGVQLAEFNAYCDAQALAIVLASGIPVTLVSWDATQHITIPYADVLRMQATSDTSAFVIQLMRAFLEQYGIAHHRHFELNDPITVLAALGIGRYEERRVQVRSDSDQYGVTREHPDGVPVRFFVPLTPDEHRWYVRIVLQTLGIVNVDASG